MTRMRTIVAGLAILVAAVLLPTAAVAGHGHTVKLKVEGECCAGGSSAITGDLQGTWEWAPDGFDTFLRTLKYDQKRGVLTFEVNEVFTGTIAGRTGQFVTRSKGIQRVLPGTPLYDFSTFPSDQPGTTGDPTRWLAGSGKAKIISATGQLAGIEGKLRFVSVEFLGRSTYRGKIELHS